MTSVVNDDMSNIDDMYLSFNTTLLDFMKDLSQSYAHIETFKKAWNIINLLTSMNPMSVQPLFDKNMSQYTKNIIARDESFFLAKDYTSELSSTGESVDLVHMVKSIWTTSMTQDDKNHVWEYLEILVALNHNIKMMNS